MNPPHEHAWEPYRRDCSRLHPSEQVLKEVCSRTIGRKRKSRRFLGPAVVLATVLLLLAATVGAATIYTHRSGWVHLASLSEAEKIGFHYPDRLGNYEVESMTRIHCAPSDSSDLHALLEPDYCWYDLQYRLDRNRTMNILFGTMENPIWSEVTETDPDAEVWYPAESKDENWTRENLQIVEYKGCTLCLWDEYMRIPDPGPDDPEEIQDAEAQWLDRESGIWFSVHFCGILSSSDGYQREAKGVSQEELLGYVRTIIDAQR